MHEDAQKSACGKEMKGAWLTTQKAWEECKKRPGELGSMAEYCSSERSDCPLCHETIWEADTIDASSATERIIAAVWFFFFFFEACYFPGNTLFNIWERDRRDTQTAIYILESVLYVKFWEYLSRNFVKKNGYVWGISQITFT